MNVLDGLFAHEWMRIDVLGIVIKVLLVFGFI